MKKDGVAQRKILTVLEANYRFGPLLRKGPLDLWGGTALASLVLETEAVIAVETPKWMWRYQAAPAVMHFEVGGLDRT